MNGVHVLKLCVSVSVVFGDSSLPAGGGRGRGYWSKLIIGHFVLRVRLYDNSRCEGE